MRLALAVAALLLAALGAPRAGFAQPAGQNPDWPCQQPLVPALTAAMIWSGPPIADLGDWHAEPAVAALVTLIAPRDVQTAQGETAIAQFTRVTAHGRKRLITLAFAGLLDETNRERGEVIERIKALAERQRHLSDLVAKLTAQLDATPAPADPSSDAAAQRADLVQRWTFSSRAYTELQHTMRYACEIPAQLDARLGAYARALAAGLS
jgi:hypothetical protein